MAVYYPGDNNPDGMSFGSDATKKISFYGGTPIVQRSSTVLATSLVSASSYVTVGSNMAALFTELSNLLTAVNLVRTTA